MGQWECRCARPGSYAVSGTPESRRELLYRLRTCAWAKSGESLRSSRGRKVGEGKASVAAELHFCHRRVAAAAANAICDGSPDLRQVLVEENMDVWQDWENQQLCNERLVASKAAHGDCMYLSNLLGLSNRSLFTGGDR